MHKERIFNFSAGPAILPTPVLETCKEALLNFKGSGIGIMEMSHRSKHFEEVIQTAEKNLRELLTITDDYAVLFATGGATMQFSMIPMNLAGTDQTADYIITGSWAQAAAKEAKKFCNVHVAASSEDKNFSYIPEKVTCSANPAYVHFTSNNTIFGTQFHKEPDVGGNVLVCDTSSDMLHKKIDVNKYGLIYAGAQKNVGPAGVTIVIIKKELLSRSKETLPILLNYNTYAANASLYNTPPTFPIFVVGEVLKWIKGLGGLSKVENMNQEKAKIIYDVLDSHSEFYEAVAEKTSRSLMNITFRLKSKDFEGTFIKEAEALGMDGLKGHRSVGGIRASIYNAFPKEGCTALANFMKDFAAKNG